jgi:hypothetical protein
MLDIGAGKGTCLKWLSAGGMLEGYEVIIDYKN